MAFPGRRVGRFGATCRFRVTRPVAAARLGRVSAAVSTVQFKRTARLAAPPRPGGEVHLEPPPEVPRTIPGNILMKFLPIVMIFMSIGMMAFMFVISKNNPTTLLMGGMMMMGTVGMMAGGTGRGNKKAEMNEDRKDYLRYLGQMRE